MAAREHPRQRSREWWCRFTLRVLAFAFAWGGIQFLFLPDVTVQSITAVGTWLGDFEPAPASALRFWLSLATGYMALVAALAYLAQRDLHRHRDLIALLILGKATTSLVALGFYLFSATTFVYLVNFVVDGGITLIVLAIWAVVPSLPHAGSLPSERLSPSAPQPGPVFRAMLEAMVPLGGPFAEGTETCAPAYDISTLIGGLGPAAESALRVGIRTMELFPFFLPPLRLRRYSRLPLEDRIHLLEAWEQSRLLPLRQLVRTLKMLVMTRFYSQPAIEARLGYAHPLTRVPRPDASA